MNILLQRDPPHHVLKMRTMTHCVSLNHVCSTEIYWDEPTLPSFVFQMRIPFWFCDTSLCPPNGENFNFRIFQELSLVCLPLYPSSSFLPSLSSGILICIPWVFPLYLKIHMICYTNLMFSGHNLWAAPIKGSSFPLHIDLVDIKAWKAL